MEKYVAYYRVSTEKQRKTKDGKARGLGLQAQEDIVKYFYPTIQAEYTDILSGKSAANRQNLQAAIKYCLDNDCTLVVAKVDRLARNVIDGLTIIETLKGRIRFCDLGPSEPDRFILTMYFAFAEREREMIRARILAAFDRKRANGDTFGRPRQFTAEDSKKGCEVRKIESMEHPDNMRAGTFIVSLRDQGMKYSDIVAKLNENHFKTRNGNRFHSSSVYYLYQKFKQAPAPCSF
jgi:DNA invertase Pin-like site-specific DNA recombinase